VGRTHDGDFTAYVDARGPGLRRTAYLACGDWHRADDITQAALLKLYRAWPRVEQSMGVDAYARRIILRVYLDELRRPWRRERPYGAVPDTTDPARPMTELRDELRHALQLMPAQQRVIVVLRYWEDMSTADVAAALGISEGGVKSQASRGLAALRGLLAGSASDAATKGTGSR
jgi:RNA polymerase sigma-70 factor (sigma-E family)